MSDREFREQLDRDLELDDEALEEAGRQDLLKRGPAELLKTRKVQ